MLHKIRQTLYFKTLSPVSVTTGEKFSPYSDFVLEGKQIIYIDKAKLKTIFENHPNRDNLIDHYVEGVVSGMDNNRSRFDLKKYLRNFLKVEPTEITLRKHSAFIKEERKIIVSEILKNPHFQPYIPGSSLKGACKTALLYDWLKNNPKGQNWLNNLVKNLYDFRSKAESDLQKEMQNYKIAFSDSSVLPMECMSIYQITRLNLKEGKTKEKGIPQLVEAINKDYTFSAEFRSENEQEENFTLNDLFRVFAQFSRDANQRDIEMLSQIKKPNETTKKLLLFYEEIQEKLENNQTCFKIGSGKGYFFNSVGLAVYHYDKKKFAEFLQVFRPAQKKINDAQNFPITRVIDAFEATPWGWLQVDTQPFAASSKTQPSETQTQSIEPQTLQSQSTEPTPEIRADYLKPGTKLKKGASIDAIVVQSGKPNKVKLMIAPENEPVFELRGYSSPLEVGSILICTIEYNEKKNQILDVIFKKLK
ncbi:MAG: type III-A CRISPR-associated RAMP protein Csm5 [Raineya sp.]|nr:type III-A CRISPR-associated RAMP protein Csm5 [Raineya sp.]